MESVIFENFTEQEQEVFLSHMQRQVYKDDTIVFLENDIADKMYIIESGVVKVYIERKNKEIELAQLKSGDFFGEMAILRKDKRSASVKTVDECKLLVIDRQTIIDIIGKNGMLAAKFLYNLAQVLASRLTETNREVENYFLINDALVENKAFRKLYFKTHKH